jgi:predicted GNAT superfamily acetyltransferase
VEPLDPAAPVVNAPEGGESGADDRAGGASAVRVEIPADIHAVLAADPGAARQWRETTRRAFLRYLGRGYRVRGVAREAASGRVFYWLAAP